jgi:hypothetical protein
MLGAVGSGYSHITTYDSPPSPWQDEGHVCLRLGSLLRDWKRRQAICQPSGATSAASAASAARSVQQPQPNDTATAVGARRGGGGGGGVTGTGVEPLICDATAVPAPPPPPPPPEKPESGEEAVPISLRPNGGVGSRPSTTLPERHAGGGVGGASGSAPVLPKQHPEPARIRTPRSATAAAPSDSDRLAAAAAAASVPLPPSTPPPPPPPLLPASAGQKKSPFESHLFTIFPTPAPRRPDGDGDGRRDALICNLGRRIVRHLAAAPPDHLAPLASLESLLLLAMRGREGLIPPLSLMEAVCAAKDHVLEILSLQVRQQ